MPAASCAEGAVAAAVAVAITATATAAGEPTWFVLGRPLRRKILECPFLGLRLSLQRWHTLQVRGLCVLAASCAEGAVAAAVAVAITATATATATVAAVALAAASTLTLATVPGRPLRRKAFI